MEVLIKKEVAVEQLHEVGKPVPRVDAREKTDGKARYINDYKFDRMLYARVFRSTKAHAKIKRLDISKALALPGVVAVVTAKDIPGKNIVPVVFNDRPLYAEEKVRYIGEAIATVAAISPEIAEKALKLIEVEYEDLPAVYDPVEAMKSEAPKIHDKGNVFVTYKIRKGDVNKGFEEADVIIEKEFKTKHQEHAYLEPQGAIVVPNADGSITVYGSMQCPYYVQNAISMLLGIPRNKVRIVQAVTGGAFGGKEDVPSWVAGEAAIAAYVTQRPVKIIYNREEDLMTTSKRHPSVIRYKMGLKNDGTIVAIKVEYILNAGAYSTLSPPVLFRGTMHVAGPYKVPNVWVDSYAVATNTVPNGAYRGFGTPQVIFAHEAMIDEAAYKLGIDPAEIRLKNALETGDETASGQVLKESVGIKETIKKAIQLSNWSEKRKSYSEMTSGTKRRGIGISSIIYGVSLGAAGKILDGSGASVQITPDGRVIVLVGTTEMGQGMRTVLSQIAAEALGVPTDYIYLPEPDTIAVPDSGPTVASRATFMSGNAILDAISIIKPVMLKIAANMLGVSENEVDVADGKFFVKDKPSKSVLFEDVAREGYLRRERLAAMGWYKAPPTFMDENGLGDVYFTYSFATHVAEVEVDMETGKVNVIDYYAVHDSGKIINPVLAEGQVQGGVAQGIGYALTEDLVLKDGRILNPNFTDYLIPSTMDVPEIKVSFVEAKDSRGPYGAKGLGEPCLMPAAAAVANAIRNATGVRMTELPMTSERVYKALKEAGKAK